MHTKQKPIHKVTRSSLGYHRCLSSPSPGSPQAWRAGWGSSRKAQSASAAQQPAAVPSEHAAPRPTRGQQPQAPPAQGRGLGELRGSRADPRRRPAPPQAGAGDGEGHPRPSGPPPPAPRAPAAARPGPGYLGGPGGAAPPAAAHSRARCRSCPPGPASTAPSPAPPPRRPRLSHGLTVRTRRSPACPGTHRVRPSALAAGSGPALPERRCRAARSREAAARGGTAPAGVGPCLPRCRAGARPGHSACGAARQPCCARGVRSWHPGLSDGCFMAPPP